MHAVVYMYYCVLHCNVLLCVVYSHRESVEYYHDNRCLPVYGHPCKGYSGEEIVKILLNPTFWEELLCTTHPVSVQNNVSFVVDLSKLKDPNDVCADDLGTWKCTGSRLLQFTVRITDTDYRLVNDISSKFNAEIVHVRRQYHVHATDPDLHRMIAFMENNDSNFMPPPTYLIEFKPSIAEIQYHRLRNCVELYF